MIRQKISLAFASLKRGRLIFLFVFCVILPTIPLGYLAFQTLSGKAETTSREINETLERVGAAFLRLASEATLDCADELIENIGRDISVGEISADIPNSKKLCPYLKSVFILDSRLTPLFPFGRSGPSVEGYLETGVTDTNREYLLKMRQGGDEEFLRRDPAAALNDYRAALKSTADVRERIVAMNAAARCCIGLKKYTDAFSYYRDILSTGEQKIFYSGLSIKLLAMFRMAEAEKLGGHEKRAAGRFLDIMRELGRGELAGSVFEAAFYAGKIAQWKSGPISDLEIGDDFTPTLERAFDQWEQMRAAALDMDRLLGVFGADFRRLLDERYESDEEYKTAFRIINGEETLLVYGLLNVTGPVSPLILGAELDTRALKNRLGPVFRKALAAEPDVNLVITGTAGETIASGGDPADSSRYELVRPLKPAFPLWQMRLSYRKHGFLFEMARGERKTRLVYILMLIVIILLGLYMTYRSVRKDSEIARLKSDFVSRVSHELRTPLATIRAMGEMLEMGAVSNREKEQEYFRAIASESERLTRLINNVLDFSRIGAGQRTYSFTKADIAKTVSDTVSAFAQYVKSEGFEVLYEAGDDIPEMSIDRDAISQAVINLMDNAVKFSRDEKTIRVELRRSGKEVALSVSDRGIGILPEDFHRIFHTFFRPAEARRHAGRGAGIGLSIVKHVAEAHGGRVDVESTHGEGSTFTITLPINE